MVGAALQKLARQNEMRIANGVAYGNFRGFATTFSEGAGYKRIDISLTFPQLGQRESIFDAVNGVNFQKEYRVQQLNVGAKFITIVFHDNPGTMKKINAFIEWFFPILEQSGATGVNICAECGAPILEGNWYLINGTAHHLHDSCASKVQEEIKTAEQQRKDEDTGSYLQGIVGAFLGAALGAVVWALVLTLGYVASLVGLLIGWLADKGYKLFQGKKGKGKLVILILAIIFGVVLGTLAADGIALAQMINNGELPGCTYIDIPEILLMLFADSEYVSATLGNVAMGLLFAALGVFMLLKRANDEVTGVSFKKMQ